MPEAGEYLFTHVGFSKDEKPLLLLQQNDALISFQLLTQTITLQFNTSTHYCTGWYDMRTGETHICPDAAITDEKYEQCPACQKRTGFNPAFYHATSVSSQQEERNLQPHILYLAYFGTGIVKVGISHAARGNARLLEQGARSALILETFPTALIARQYEADIAALPDIAETIQLRKKLIALAQPYNTTAAETELLNAKIRIEKSLQTTFASKKVVSFDSVFFSKAAPDLKNAYDFMDKQLISGQVIGMIGSILFCTQQGEILFLPLKKFIGTRLTLSYQEIPITLPSRQTSLF